MARDGLENEAKTPLFPALTVQTSVPDGTGITKPEKSSKEKEKSATKERPLPKGKKSARPPSVAGYTWRKDGAGFQLRKTVYESDGAGTTKRKRPYVAHLSKSAYQEMKRQHRGAALERAIAQWVADHDR